jgi:hypothetical protein
MGEGMGHGAWSIGKYSAQLVYHAERSVHSFNKKALPRGEGFFVTGSGARIRT